MGLVASSCIGDVRRMLLLLLRRQVLWQRLGVFSTWYMLLPRQKMLLLRLRLRLRLLQSGLMSTLGFKEGLLVRVLQH